MLAGLNPGQASTRARFRFSPLLPPSEPRIRRQFLVPRPAFRIGMGHHIGVFTDTPDGAAVIVRVTPRAGRSALAGLREGMLAVRIAAAPVEGAANRALIELLATVLDVPRGSLHVASGSRGRVKRVIARGASAATLNERLERALTSS
jgi:hypothetical protein